MHAAGVPLTELGIPDRTNRSLPATPRDVCAHSARTGTFMRERHPATVLQHAFGEQFGSPMHPSPENADALFDRIDAALATDTSARGRCSTSSASRSWRPPMIRWTTSRPTPRSRSTHPSPDGSFRPSSRRLPRRLTRIRRQCRPAGRLERHRRFELRGYLDALAGRRRYFVDHGAVSQTHGVLHRSRSTCRHPRPPECSNRALAGSLDAAEQRVSPVTCCWRWLG
jgi:glucuronate isomerase